MNKQELIDAISAKASVTKKEADSILTATVDTIMDAVSSGNKVTLVGFGTFEARQRKAREGRNPATGKTCLLYTSPSPRDLSTSRMPSSA